MDSPFSFFSFLNILHSPFVDERKPKLSQTSKEIEPFKPQLCNYRITSSFPFLNLLFALCALGRSVPVESPTH